MSDRVPKYNPKPFMQGDTWTMTIYVRDENDSPFNLTGYSATYELRDKASGTSLIKLTSTPSAGIAINLLTGSIVLTITSTQSAALTFLKAKCQLKIASSATPPVVQTLFIGEQELISRIAQ